MATLSRLLPVSLAAALALSLGACASSQDDSAPSAPPASATQPAPGTAPEAPPATAPGDMTAQCNADAAQSFVGKPATDATVAEAKAAAGAKGALRLIKPGQAVTMDFRGDRLNVEVDEQNAIVRITCG